MKKMRVQFVDSFTGKVLNGIEFVFENDPVSMMRGEIRKWIIDLKPIIDLAYRRTDRLHGKLLTKITTLYNG